jgi:NADH-quinone oxidoreductase subunit N
MGLELQSLALYVLAAFARNNPRAAEAGIKYFALGAISSGMILFGTSLIYGYTGSLDYGAVSASMASAADGAPSAPAGRASTIPRSTRASTPPQQNLSQPVTSAADSPDTQTSSAAAETPGAERAPLETVAPDHSVTPTPTPTP